MTAPLIAAPLLGATTGTLVYSSFTGGSPTSITQSYIYLLPYNYSTSYSYPLVLYLHQLDQANPFYQSGQGADLVGPQITPWFNTAQFRTSFPCIVIAPLCNQLADTSGQTINWGGITVGDMPPQDNAIALTQFFMANYSVNPNNVFLTGNSMGGQGGWDFMIKWNIQNGTTGKIFQKALLLADGPISYGSTPSSGIQNQLRTVPIYSIRGGSDTEVPASWDHGLYADYGGSTAYNGSKAPNGTYWYLEDPSLGHDVWDTYYPMQTGLPFWLWLFNANTATPKLLPSGYLSTNGNQVVDSNGNPVRIASVGWHGGDGNGNAVMGLDAVPLATTCAQLVATGFNCVRIPYNDAGFFEGGATYLNSSNGTYNPSLVGQTPLQVLDATIAACTTAGLKVILDHHTNEGGQGGNGGQQVNGLWMDSGPGTNGTDGSGNTGTVTYAKFKANWVALAQRYNGNSTVIGFDLHNEPTMAGSAQYGTQITWGGGGVTDIHAMFQDVGNAILAANPGVLIICEGPQNYNGSFGGGGVVAPSGDLTLVQGQPVVLSVNNKVVYSVHEYPNNVSGVSTDQGAAAWNRMNGGWGFVVANNIAPVWVGEGGCYVQYNDAATTTDVLNWALTMGAYTNGYAPSGPTFNGNQQGISWDWWSWSVNESGQGLGGTQNFGALSAWNGGYPLLDQWDAYSQFFFTGATGSGGGGGPPPPPPTSGVYNIHVGLAAWQSKAYTAGARVANNGRAYQCIRPGTAAASGGPTGQGPVILDGTVLWLYLSAIDFSSIAGAVAGLPATFTQNIIWNFWNDGPISTPAATPLLTLTGHSMGSFSLTITCAPGESIRDSLHSQSVPFHADASKGVAWVLPTAANAAINYIEIGDATVIIDGIQMIDPQSDSGSTILIQDNSCASLTLRNCIVDGYAQAGGAVMLQLGNSGNTSATTFANCLIIDRQPAAAANYTISMQPGATVRMAGCTIVSTNGNTGGFFLLCSSNPTAPAIIQDCAVFGFGSPFGQPAMQISYSATQNANWGSATDSGHNQFSASQAAQFVSTSDFRLIPGAICLNNGTPDLTDIPSADDIAMTPRGKQGPGWHIGAWERLSYSTENVRPQIPIQVWG